jgi:hypothetical protein
MNSLLDLPSTTLATLEEDILILLSPVKYFPFYCMRWRALHKIFLVFYCFLVLLFRGGETLIAYKETKIGHNSRPIKQIPLDVAD